jgi:hypothetical protein
VPERLLSPECLPATQSDNIIAFFNAGFRKKSLSNIVVTIQSAENFPPL